jgi:hypothetical protein
MFDFEEAIVELVVRAAEARGRARVAREDARALQAAARQTNTVASERRAASERLGARRA